MNYRYTYNILISTLVSCGLRCMPTPTNCILFSIQYFPCGTHIVNILQLNNAIVIYLWLTLLLLICNFCIYWTKQKSLSNKWKMRLVLLPCQLLIGLGKFTSLLSSAKTTSSTNFDTLCFLQAPTLLVNSLFGI